MKCKIIYTIILFLNLSDFAVAQIPFRTDEGWHLVDEKSKKAISTAVFESLQIIDENRLKVVQKGLTGIIKTDGTWILQPKYADIEAKAEFYFVATLAQGVNVQSDLDNKKLWGVVDFSGQVIIEPTYHQILYGDKFHFIVQVNNEEGSWGVIDLKGNWVANPIYPSTIADESLPSITMVSPNYLIYNNKKLNVYEIRNFVTQESIRIKSGGYGTLEFFKGKAVINYDQEASLIDISGNIIIPKTPGQIFQTKSDLVFNMKEKQTVMYSSAGKKLKVFDRYFVSHSTNKYILLNNYEGAILLNSEGEVLKKIKSKACQLFDNDILYVEESEQSRMFINLFTGDTVLVPSNYGAINYDPASGLGIVTYRDVDKYQQSEENEFIYDYKSGSFKTGGYKKLLHWKDDYFLAFFHDRSFAIVNGVTDEAFFKLTPNFTVRRKNGKYGILNTYKQKIYDAEYDELKAVERTQNLFIGRIGKQYFIVDGAKEQKSIAFDEILFSYGNFMVLKEGKAGLINLQLEEITPRLYTKMEDFNGENITFYIVSEQYFGSYGLLDQTGKVILDLKFDSYEVVEEKLLIFESNDKYIFLDSEGKQIKALAGVIGYKKTEVKDFMHVRFSDKGALFQISTGQLFVIPKEYYNYVSTIEVDSSHQYFMYENKKKQSSLFDAKGQLILNLGNVLQFGNKNAPIAFIQTKKQSTVLSVNEGRLEQTIYTDFLALDQNYGANLKLYARKALGEKNYQIVDEHFKPLSNTYFQKLEESKQGIVATNLEGMVGFLDVEGQLRIDYQYDAFLEDYRSYLVFKKGDELHLYNQFYQRVLKDLKIQSIGNVKDGDDQNFLEIVVGNKITIVNVETDSVVISDIISTSYDEAIYFLYTVEEAGPARLVIVESESGFGLYSLTSEAYIIEPVNKSLKLINEDPYSPIIKVNRGNLYNYFYFRNLDYLFRKDVGIILFDEKNNALKAITNDSIFLSFIHNENDGFSTPIATEIEYRNATFSISDEIELDNDYVIRVEFGKKVGIMHSNGQWIHRPTLDNIDAFIGQEFIVVKKKSLHYLINLDGKYITDKGFDIILESELEGMVARGYIGDDIYDISKDGAVTLSK